MSAKVDDGAQMMNREYMQSFCILKASRIPNLQRIVDYLKDYCFAHAIVSGRGKGKVYIT